MIETIDADDAWWPPTFTPEAVARTLFAQWTMLVASQSIRVSIEANTSRSRAAARAGLPATALTPAPRSTDVARRSRATEVAVRRRLWREGLRRRQTLGRGLGSGKH